MVGLNDAAELLLAAKGSDGLGPEGLVQYLVVHADPPMWPFSIVMPDPADS